MPVQERLQPLKGQPLLTKYPLIRDAVIDKKIDIRLLNKGAFAHLGTEFLARIPCAGQRFLPKEAGGDEDEQDEAGELQESLRPLFGIDEIAQQQREKEEQPEVEIDVAG